MRLRPLISWRGRPPLFIIHCQKTPAHGYPPKGERALCETLFILYHSSFIIYTVPFIHSKNTHKGCKNSKYNKQDQLYD